MKSMKERVIHALLFEIGALLLMVPLAAGVLNHSWEHIGMLGVMLSLCAMFWNMVFNAIFERIEKRFNLTRTFGVRAGHALAFEAGLLLLTVPVAAWWMEMSLWQALLLDIAFVLLILPYTMLFNWVYDSLRNTKWAESLTMFRL